MLWARESIGRTLILPPRSRRPAARSNRRNGFSGAWRREGPHAERKRFTMAEPVYRRVVIKISGEFLAGKQAFGIDQTTVDRIAGDLIGARQLGAEIAVVVGGGNIVRGVEVSSRGVSRPTGDTMGMLATVMNCLALEAAIERRGRPPRPHPAADLPPTWGKFHPRRGHQKPPQNRNLVAGGGKRQPVFPPPAHGGSPGARKRSAA